MWQIDNRTPFAADRDWTRAPDGTETWLVAVKATFDIRADGSTEISAHQPPVLRSPEYFGEPGKSSLKYDTDLILSKRTTDILVVGHACAPAGRKVESLDVGFRVGATQKVLRVFGDRLWGQWGPSRPEPFSALPLVYERAFGGTDERSEHPQRDWDWRNPVGCGFAVDAAHLRQRRLPNIELPGQLISSWSDRPEPAGFGAIDAHWKARAVHAGTYGERWMAERRPLPPDDFDERFYQCAAADQRPPSFIYGGEAVTLVNLSTRPRIQFALPRLHLGFDSRFLDGSHELHANRRLHTVILEPDFPRVSLVWHSALPCHFKPYKLERTVITLKQDVRTGERISEHEDLEFM